MKDKDNKHPHDSEGLTNSRKEHHKKVSNRGRSLSITKLAETLKLKFKLPAFHFIELYIYFSNFINGNSISKDSFSIANMNLITTYKGNTSPFDEQTVGLKFTNGIMNALDSMQDSILIESLIHYLKLLSYAQSVAITEDILFTILDKEEKGYVTYPDVLNFIIGLEEFITPQCENESTSSGHQEFNNKLMQKLFKKKKEKEMSNAMLEKSNFLIVAKKVREDIEGLLKEAEDVINRKLVDSKVSKTKKKKFDIPNVETINLINIDYLTESSKDKEESSREKESSISKQTMKQKIIAEEFLEKANNQKKKIHHPPEKEKEESIANIPSIPKKNKLTNENQMIHKINPTSPETAENENADRKTSLNIRNFSIRDSLTQNIYRTNSLCTLGYNVPRESNVNNIFSIPFSNYKNIYEIALDMRKKEAVERIRMQSYLYDLSLSDLASDFSLLSEKIDKNTFVDTMTGIITKHTSEFNSYVKKLALSELFSIIDTDLKNEITPQEAIGAIIPLTHESAEAKMKMIWLIFSQGKRDALLLISGMLSLYLNTGLISDPKILSEMLVEKLITLNFSENYSAFLEWMNSEIGETNRNHSQSQSEMDDEENKIDVNYNDMKASPPLMSMVITKILDSIQSFRIQIDPSIKNLNISIIAEIFKGYSLVGEINKNQIISALEKIIERSKIIIKENEKRDYINSLVDILGLDFSKFELFEISLIHSKLILLFDGSAQEKINSVFYIFDCLENNTGLSYNELYTFMHGSIQFFLSNTVDMNTSPQLITEATSLLLDEIFKYSNRNKKSDTICPKDMIEFYYSLVHFEN